MIYRNIVCGLLIFVIGDLVAQDIVKFHPFGALLGRNYFFEYEKYLHDDASINGYFSLNDATHFDIFDNSKYNLGMFVGAGYKWYLTNNDRPKGFYAGPALGILNFFPKRQYQHYGLSTSVVAIVGAGYQHVFFEKLTAAMDFVIRYHQNLSGAYEIIPGLYLNVGYIIFEQLQILEEMYMEQVKTFEAFSQMLAFMPNNQGCREYLEIVRWNGQPTITQ